MAHRARLSHPRSLLLALCLGFGVCLAPTARAQDCSDTADPDPLADCDGDGTSVAEGDCDDFDDATYPGAPEICGNERDEDCDDTADDGCDDTLERAELGGGSSCADGGSWAAVILLPLAGLGRRRRS